MPDFQDFSPLYVSGRLFDSADTTTTNNGKFNLKLKLGKIVDKTGFDRVKPGIGSPKPL